MNSFTKLIFTLATLSSVLANQTDWPSGTPSWVPSVMGVVLIAVGLLFLFFGKIFTRVLFAFAGGLLLGGGTMYIVYAIQKSTKFTIVLAIVVVIAAIIGGLIGMYLLKLGVLILGALVGVSLTMLLGSTGLLSNTVLYIIGAILVLGIVVWTYFSKDNKIIIIPFASINGAFIAMTGLDCYINTGFRTFVSSLTTTKADIKIIVMLISTLILAAIGMAVQFFYGNRKKD